MPTGVTLAQTLERRRFRPQYPFTSLNDLGRKITSYKAHRAQTLSSMFWPKLHWGWAKSSSRSLDAVALSSHGSTPICKASRARVVECRPILRLYEPSPGLSSLVQPEVPTLHDDEVVTGVPLACRWRAAAVPCSAVPLAWRCGWVGDSRPPVTTLMK